MRGILIVLQYTFLVFPPQDLATPIYFSSPAEQLSEFDMMVEY